MLPETLRVYVVDIWYEGCCSYPGVDRYIANKDEITM